MYKLLVAILRAEGNLILSKLGVESVDELMVIIVLNPHFSNSEMLK